MQADAATYQPWRQHFRLDILKQVDKDGANDAERYYISVLESKAPKGYNKLKGSCTSSRQFWKLHRAGLLNRC